MIYSLPTVLFVLMPLFSKLLKNVSSVCIEFMNCPWYFRLVSEPFFTPKEYLQELKSWE